jgi:uncharacterized protein YdeI (YjbR/CyaY-like superfamily)
METFAPSSRQDWHNWLKEHHQTESSIWLIYYKKDSNKPTVSYSDAVDEALCFGWIDSKVKSIDEHSFMQFFSQRKPKSVWSKVNKAKVQYLIDEELMEEAGYESIRIAKENGSWTILDAVEALIIPEDLEQSFRDNSGTKDYFESLSRSDKRNILQWLVLAKRPETREKRIQDIIVSAQNNQKPSILR